MIVYNSLHYGRSGKKLISASSKKISSYNFFNSTEDFYTGYDISVGNFNMSVSGSNRPGKSRSYIKSKTKGQEW